MPEKKRGGCSSGSCEKKMRLPGIIPISCNSGKSQGCNLSPMPSQVNSLEVKSQAAGSVADGKMGTHSPSSAVIYTVVKR